MPCRIISPGFGRQHTVAASDLPLGSYNLMEDDNMFRDNGVANGDLLACVGFQAE